MTGRGSVWSDERLVARAAAFVPAADEVWRLQRGLGPESRAFQAFADRAHYREPGGTRQGIYVCTPGGALLASVNALDPDQVLATLERGLAAWEALDERARRADAARAPHDLGAEARWERSYPADGLVLRCVGRDLPAALDPRAPPPDARSNQDHVWLSADEARALVPAGVRPGEAWELVPLARRLARFHLVDNVRGQTLPFAEPEVAGSWLRARAVAEDGARLALALEGATRASSDGTWLLGENDWTPERPWPRRLEARLAGRAVWDRAAERFVSFELVALGLRTGTTGLNGRDPGSSGPIGFLVTLAPDEPAERLPPAFADVYDAPWLRERASDTGAERALEGSAAAGSD